MGPILIEYTLLKIGWRISSYTKQISQQTKLQKL